MGKLGTDVEYELLTAPYKVALQVLDVGASATYAYQLGLAHTPLS